MTHLPLRRSYFWRDPVYKDKNEETEEYDDYHNINRDSDTIHDHAAA